MKMNLIEQSALPQKRKSKQKKQNENHHSIIHWDRSGPTVAMLGAK
jgi:hypothetical protein